MHQLITMGSVYDHSAVQVTHTGNTSEQTLATIPILANVLGAHGVLRITVQMGATGTAGTKQLRIKFGGTTFRDSGAMGASTLSSRTQCQITNRSATSQVGNASDQTNWGGSNSAVVTASIDTTSTQNITITGQLGNSADTIALESYLVELLQL
jgi:hypothetical protein